MADQTVAWNERNIEIIANYKLVLEEIQKGKKLIIYGGNELAEQFQSQFNLDVVCCVDDNNSGLCCGKPVLQI
jgi:dihydrofolate reductase